jgi:hypothetical protein
MFIEMTTFAIPTFIVKGLVFLMWVALGWVVTSVIVLSAYSYFTARNIERQMRIDAEIDRLHK